MAAYLPYDNRVKQLQQKLNEYDDAHVYYPLAVDGLLGPKTCHASYHFNQEFLDDYGHRLTSEFFTALDLPASWANTNLATACRAGFTGDEGQDDWDAAGSGNVPAGPSNSAPMGPAIDDDAGGTDVSKLGVPKNHKVALFAGLLGGVAGLLGGLAARPYIMKRTRPKKAAYAGAAVGAIGGLLIGYTALQPRNSFGAAGMGAVIRNPGLGYQKVPRSVRHMWSGGPGKRELGYIPTLVESNWDRRGAVGELGSDGIKRYC